MTIHYAKRGQAIIGGCTAGPDDRTFARWGAVDQAGTQVDCSSCLTYRPVVENDQFIAMLQRQIRQLEERVIADPALLTQVIMLAQRLSEIPNVVIAQSATRYSINPMSAPSMAELAKLLGMAKQSASERRKLGDRTLFERSMGESSITQRERQARTVAARHAETTMADWFARRSDDAVPSA